MEEKYICRCCTKHVPLPVELNPLITPSGVVYLCPTSFYNLLALIAEYMSFYGRPPGSIRKHYSEYVQSLAAEIWDKVRVGN